MLGVVLCRPVQVGTVGSVPVLIAGSFVVNGVIVALIPGVVVGAAALSWTQAAITLGWMASIVLHELGHALVARRGSITIHATVFASLGAWVLLNPMAMRARDHVRISLAGPLVNLVVAAVATAVLAQLGHDPRDLITPGPDTATDAAAQVLAALVLVNASLAALNLLPILPLDGGCVLLHGWAWLTGDGVRAVLVAVAADLCVPVVIVGAAALSLSVDEAVGVTVGVAALVMPGGGLPTARAELERSLAAGLPATAGLAAEQPVWSSATTAGVAVEVLVGLHATCHAPVVDDAGRHLGCVHAPALRAAGPDTTLGSMAVAPSKDPHVACCLQDERLRSVLLLNRDVVLVDRDGRLRGVATPDGVRRAIVREARRRQLLPVVLRHLLTPETRALLDAEVAWAPPRLVPLEQTPGG